MKRIPLTQGKYAIVDDEDYEELSKHKWYTNKNGNTYYARRNSKRDLVTHKQSTIKMHCVIMETPDGMDTDHINGDGLDNRRVNLRVCTHSQNMCNRGKQLNNKSHFVGVSWENKNKKWKSQIEINKKKKHLGYFTTPELAHEAYCTAAKELHKEYANLG